MPVVRRYGPRQVLPEPGPLVVETSESLGAVVAAAEQATARRLQAFGADLGVATKEFAALVKARHLEEQDANVQAADRQLAEFELRTLTDPDHGMTRVRGQAAGGLLDATTDAFDRRADELARELTSDAERRAFAAVRDRRREGLQRSVAAYSERELQAFAVREYDASLRLARDAAILHFEDLERVRHELDRTEALIDLEPGLGPEARTVRKAEAVSQIHEGIVAAYLAVGRSSVAGQYFAQHYERIASARRPALQEAITTAGQEAMALRVADAIWAPVAPTTEADPLPAIDAMEAAVRTQLPDDERAQRTAVAILRERRAGVALARQDRQDRLAGALWGAASEGLTLPQLRQRPEWGQADGRLRQDLTRYLRDAAEGRLRTESTVREAERETRGWAAYWQYSDPAVLSRTSEAAIQTMLPDIGQDAVNRLLQAKRAQAAPAAVREATIDAELFKQLADRAGYEPYESGGTEAARSRRAERLGRLRARVEDAIDADQGDKRRRLTRRETADLMQFVLDEEALGPLARAQRYGRLPGDVELRPDAPALPPMPAALRAQAIDALQRAGRDVTEAAIQALYRAYVAPSQAR